jgi:RimJ/RimL family protein N-acetyltransferase
MAFSLIQLNEADLAEVAAARIPRAFAERLEEGALPPAFVATRALSLRSAGVPDLWSCTFLIASDDDGRIVGSCGFKSAPKAGRVEIGYGVAPGSRGRGAATAAVKLLVTTALGSGADEVLAEVSPTNLASLRVVQKAGFRHVGARVDEDQEHVLQWVASL